MIRPAAEHLPCGSHRDLLVLRGCSLLVPGLLGNRRESISETHRSETAGAWRGHTSFPSCVGTIPKPFPLFTRPFSRTVCRCVHLVNKRQLRFPRARDPALGTQQRRGREEALPWGSVQSPRPRRSPPQRLVPTAVDVLSTTLWCRYITSTFQVRASSETVGVSSSPTRWAPLSCVCSFANTPPLSFPPS